MSVYSLGTPIRIHVSERFVEDARLLEYRCNNAFALVEWRGVFCEINSRRILPESEADATKRQLQSLFNATT